MNRPRNPKSEDTGWWANTPLRAFDPVLNFANENLSEANWADAVSAAMGDEQSVWLTYELDGTRVTERIWRADVMAHMSERLGIGWCFLSDDEVKVTKMIQGAIVEQRPYMPKVFGEEANFDRVQALQSKVRQVLDCLVATVHQVDRQRRGEEGYAWIEQCRQRDVAFRLTGHASSQDYSQWPWVVSHFNAHQAILTLISQQLGAPDVRTAVIHRTGFIGFEDLGEDAAITLGWMLIGLAEKAFQRESPILKKCPQCECFFLHETKKVKRFCSAHCRFDHHNHAQKVMG